MSKNCGKIGLLVKFLHLSVRIFTKWWLRKNYKWNKLEKNSVSMKEIKRARARKSAAVCWKSRYHCCRLLSLGPRQWTKGVSADHKASTLCLTFYASLYLICLFVFWQSFSDLTTLFLSSFPSMYVLLQSITERLHDSAARPAPRKLKDSGNCSCPWEASIFFFISKTQDRCHFHLLTWKMPGSVSFLSI